MNRKELAARIRAILSKTEQQGCTEAEAASAAAIAKSLLDKYQFDLSDLELEQEGCSQFTSKNDLKRGEYDIRTRLLLAIGAFCEVKPWMNSREHTVTFYGLQSDAEFATWLCESLTSFVKREADRYKLGNLVDTLATDGNFYIPPLLEVNAFRAGCIDKINERLQFEAAKRKQTAAYQTHNALVVKKSAIVTREFNKLGIHLGSARGYRGSHSGGGAYSKGKAAGDRASFGRPVGGGATGGQLKIGSR